MADQTPTDASKTWWKNGYVWMVLGGPLAVIVASCVTFVIAARGADQVLESPAKVVESAKKGVTPAEDAMVPAVQGRNHAAGGAAQPKE